jgi:CRP-like cAMP-binding protein
MITIDDPILKVLSKVPLFAGLDRMHLIWYLSMSERRDVAAGGQFFDEQDPGATCFVLIRGTAVVERSIAGETVVIDELRPGDTFGEVSLVDSHPRFSRVKAITDAVALEFKTPPLDTAPETAMVIFKNIAKMQSLRIRRNNEKLYVK